MTIKIYLILQCAISEDHFLEIWSIFINIDNYSKTCVKRPLSKRQKIG